MASGNFIYREEDHYQNYCAQVEELWRGRQLCDINLIVENTDGKPIVSVPAHRVILAANIPYFKAMLTSEMQESSQREVTLRNVDDDGLKRIVSYAYTGKIEITEVAAQGLLVTASMVGLPLIVQACENFMAKHVSPANCLGLEVFARLHELNDLSTIANNFSMNHFTAVSKEEEFLGISVEAIENFVESDKININSEEDVYEAVTRWIHSNPDERKQYSDRLYKHVRFPILSLNWLNIVKQNPLITESSAGKIMLQEAFDYHENPASVILFSSPKKIQPRSSVMGVLCVVGGAGDSGESLNEVTFFSPHEQHWRSGTKMQCHRSRLALALFQGELYAIGGCDVSDSLASVEKYSPSSNCWMRVASLNAARRSCAAVVTKGGIYAIGGCSGSVFLKSVERYDAELDEWTYQPAMIESRSELAAVFFDQRLYAIGGFNSQSQHLRSVERFDLINRKWEKIADMYAPRANAGMSTLITQLCSIDY